MDLDLAHMEWPPLVLTADGLEISSTCTIAELVAIDAPTDWPACELFEPCARALLTSVDSWKTATVGGNLCTALPAGAMISLTAALDGVCTILTPDGGGRRVSVAGFVTGAGCNGLAPGELLRSIFLPAAALRCRTALRRGSQQPDGRSTALVIGRLDRASGAFKLTITAATPRPVVLKFARPPASDELRAAITDRLAPSAFLHDAQGDSAARERLTLAFAEEIRAGLLAPLARRPG
jgi:CO/xanthine dehydrogenase FAD-binding subunit